MGEAAHGNASRTRWSAPQLLVAVFSVGVLVGAAGVLVMTNDDAPVVALPSSVPVPTQPATVVADVVSYDPSMITVEYEIVTDGMSVTHLSWVDVVDGATEMVEKLGTPPPFRHVIQLPKGEPFDLTDLSVTGMGAATSTTTTCTMRVDGKVVARQTAEGTYGVVSCALPEG